jgi:hypothetical protein
MTTVMARPGAAIYFDAAGARIAGPSAPAREPTRESIHVT